MADRSMDTIIIDILNERKDLPCSLSKPCIFKVDKHLQSDVCVNIYEPELLAIGPYHHGKSHLQYMQNLKHVYLKRLLERRTEVSMYTLVKCVVDMEKRARKCYSEPLDLTESEFVKVMLLDGCFLIELFRYFSHCIIRDVNDPVFVQERIMTRLGHDIFLLENQLPFFVLIQLFNITKNTEDYSDELIPLVLRFGNGMFLNYTHTRLCVSLVFKNRIDPDHLVGLIHYALCLPGRNANDNGIIEDRLKNITSISVLQEFGIKLREVKGYFTSLLNITFLNGELGIPRLRIYNETESQLRNMVAYEQYFPDGEIRYVSDYIFFMQCLINNSQDVELLRSNGIIENYLGDDEKVCLMFNRVGRNILTSSNFCYSQVFNNVDKHCRPVK